MNHLREYLLAVTLLPLLLVAWAVVQHHWRRYFHVNDAEGDVLAGRGGCGACGCTTPCEPQVRGRRARHNGCGHGDGTAEEDPLIEGQTS